MHSICNLRMFFTFVKMQTKRFLLIGMILNDAALQLETATDGQHLLMQANGLPLHGQHFTWALDAMGSTLLEQIFVVFDLH